jgi:hypothetical protein
MFGRCKSVNAKSCKLRITDFSARDAALPARAGLRAVRSAVCSVCGRRSLESCSGPVIVPSKRHERAAFEGSDAMRPSKFMKTGWMMVGGVTAAILAGTDTDVARDQERKAAVVQPLVLEVSQALTVIGKVLGFRSNFPVTSWGLPGISEVSSAVANIQRSAARLLPVNHGSMESGGTLRIIGAVPGRGNAKQFVARTVQKCPATLLRTAEGFSLSQEAPINAEKAGQRGVR